MHRLLVGTFKRDYMEDLGTNVRKMFERDREGIRLEGLDCIHLYRDRDSSLTLENTVINRWVP